MITSVEEMMLLEALLIGVDPVALDELRHPPAWHRDALCKEYRTGRFHMPPRGASSEPAKEVCSRCLVRQECAAYALADSSLLGVWGGMSGRERRLMRAGRRAA